MIVTTSSLRPHIPTCPNARTRISSPLRALRVDQPVTVRLSRSNVRAARLLTITFSCQALGFGGNGRGDQAQATCLGAADHRASSPPRRRPAQSQPVTSHPHKDSIYLHLFLWRDKSSTTIKLKKGHLKYKHGAAKPYASTFFRLRCSSGLTLRTRETIFSTTSGPFFFTSASSFFSCSSLSVSIVVCDVDVCEVCCGLAIRRVVYSFLRARRAG